MIEYDDEQAASQAPLPYGILTAGSRETLSAAMNTLQSAGLLGLNDKKREAALKELSPDAIKDIQKSLAKAGFKNVGKIDGVAGEKTIKGIKQALAKNTLTEIFAEKNASDQETVSRIQESLNTLGHDSGKVDGKFGPKTADAVGRYINKEHFSGSPIPGDVQAKLEEHNVRLEAKAAPAAPRNILLKNTESAFLSALGARHQDAEDVKLVQERLQDRGYYNDEIDGKFGKKTTSAFVKFLEENPAYHSSVGPDLLRKTESYALDNKVSDQLRKSLHMKDPEKLAEVTNDVRYDAYRNYFAAQGKPVDLARGIKAASELTGVPMKDLFAVMRHESANFGDYNPRKGNSSANRIPNNYGQFIDSTYRYMSKTFGNLAHDALASVGIHMNKGDWRSDPLTAPYMVAKYLDKVKSYAAYVLPAMQHKGNSNAIVAEQYPAAARSNRHIFYDGRRALSFAEANHKIIGTLNDDYAVERKIVEKALREASRKNSLRGSDEYEDYKDNKDGKDAPAAPYKRDIDVNKSIGLVGDENNPEKSTAKLNLAGSFKQASLADAPETPNDPNGRGPKPSGFVPSFTNDFV
jgi:peptidoglycan hydrolase-like protein with peptidoglycan-binding domain